MRSNSFSRTLDGLIKTVKEVESLSQKIKMLYELGREEGAYSSAVELEKQAEKLVLTARLLPVYTGNPRAETDVRQTISELVPIEIGFTEEGWFQLRIPALLPKKESGNANYIRSSLYPAMRGFFIDKAPVRYDDCVIAYRHIYGRDFPQRLKRDHDNIEVNMVTDILALYILSDDGPGICSQFQTSTEGGENMTEVYAVPRAEFPFWLRKMQFY